MPDWYLNEQPAADLFWFIDADGDALTAPEVRVPLTPLWARMGAAVTGAPILAARTLTLQGRVLVPSNSIGDRRAAEDRLKDLFRNEGLLTLRHEDGAVVREIDAYCTEARFTPNTVASLAPASTLRAAFACPEVSWRTPAGSIVAIPASTRTPIPLGTAPCPANIRIMGSGTNPVLEWRDATGAIRAQYNFTITLGTNDWLDVDLADAMVWKTVSGTRSSALSTLTVTTGPWPTAIDPGHGSYAHGLWPTLRVANAAAAEVLYTKRYW